jgi:hypothetical protein
MFDEATQKKTKMQIFSMNLLLVPLAGDRERVENILARHQSMSIGIVHSSENRAWDDISPWIGD